MKNTLTVTAALLLTTTAAHAVGLDRSNQNVSVIFEEGTYLEFSVGAIRPSLDGTDAFPNPVDGTQRSTGGVGSNFEQYSFAFKTDITDQLSATVIYDEPFGADITYPTFEEGGSFTLGGTEAILNSETVSGILRYKINDNFSVHGGIRIQTLDATISLGGVGFGGLDGFTTDLNESTEVGYLVGVAYERPDIALRVSLTYFNEIDHNFPTEVNGTDVSDTDVSTPEAINLRFQTGIAANTLLFGSVRYADYDTVITDPEGFPGTSLTDIDSGFSYTIGLGRQFTDKFSASLSGAFGGGENDEFQSPLAPTTDGYSVTLGGKYDVTEQFAVSAGVTYADLGNSTPGVFNPALGETVGLAEFDNNDAIGFGVKFGYRF